MVKAYIMFGLTILIVAALCTTLMAMRLTVGYDISFVWKILIWAVIFCAWCAPFTTFSRNKELIGTWFDIYTYSMYFLFVVVFLLFSGIIIRDIIWFVGHYVVPVIKASPFDLTALLWTNVGLVTIAVITSSVSLWNGLTVPALKPVEIVSNKIKQPITIAVLSDLHISRTLSVNKIKQIVKRTNAAKPDVIVLPGDVIDDSAEFIEPYIAELKKLNAPKGVYVSMGNHEFYVGIKASQEVFKLSGLKELSDSGASIADDVYLAGIPDDKSYLRFVGHTVDMVKAMDHAKPEQYRVLLSHDPRFVDTLKAGEVDLQISGHTHGGQIFPFHILVKLANGYLAGFYKTDHAMLYITRGSGQWGPQMRLLSPSEITLITLKPKN